MSASTGRILVIRGGAIGDFILTLPVLAALRDHLPAARIEVLGYRHVARLASESGLADDVRSIEARSLAGFFARDGQLDPKLQEYFSSFAIIVSYLFDPDEMFLSNIRRCSQAQFIAGPHRPDERTPVHATEVFLKPLERLAIFGADPIPRLRLGACEPTSPPRLGLHPGSGSERKNWPESRWAQFIEGLGRDGNHRLLLVGGEAEGDRLNRLAHTVASERIELAQSQPLVEVARRLQNCAAFVGHDSGITHLAAALGVPVLALWGETNEAVWRPTGDSVRVLRTPQGLAALSVHAVFANLETLLADGR